MRQIFEASTGRLSCKRVCAFMFCVASIVMAFIKYDFDTTCLMAGSCISLLGAGLIETRNIKTNCNSSADSKSKPEL